MVDARAAYRHADPVPIEHASGTAQQTGALAINGGE
jgi:hypothetical protein